VNLREILATEEYFVSSCNCQLGVGTSVTVDGLTSRGVVVRKNGRRVVIQVKNWRGGEGFNSGYRIEKDQSFVHPLGKGPGE
jgi:hypothetical protein